jgi:hypothetical protein
VNIQETFSEHSVNIRGTFSEHLDNRTDKSLPQAVPVVYEDGSVVYEDIYEDTYEDTDQDVYVHSAPAKGGAAVAQPPSTAAPPPPQHPPPPCSAAAAPARNVRRGLAFPQEVCNVCWMFAECLLNVR